MIEMQYLVERNNRGRYPTTSIQIYEGMIQLWDLGYFSLESLISQGMKMSCILEDDVLWLELTSNQFYKRSSQLFNTVLESSIPKNRIRDLLSKYSHQIISVPEFDDRFQVHEADLLHNYERKYWLIKANTQYDLIRLATS